MTIKSTQSTFPIFSSVTQIVKDEEGEVVQPGPASRAKSIVEVRSDLNSEFRKIKDGNTSVIINLNSQSPDFVFNADTKNIKSLNTMVGSLVIDDGYFLEEHAKDKSQSIVCGLACRFKIVITGENGSDIEKAQFDIIDNKKEGILNIEPMKFTQFKKDVVSFLYDMQASENDNDHILRIMNTSISS